jgi:glycosyltransferase involved in cell wall biosynthesis
MVQQILSIAHVTATFPPYFGGTGTVCFHNARVLASRGHRVSVYTAEWDGQSDDPPGVEVHRLRPVVHVGNAPVMPQLLRMPRNAIVHLHFPFYAGGELVSLSRRPYVVTYHQDVEIDGLLGRLTSAHDATIGRQVLRRARRLCPTSLDYFQSSRFAGLIPAMANRISPIPNGVDTSVYRPGPPDPALRARYSLPESMPIVLFVGSMDRAHHFKGIPVLLQALATTGDVAALLIGDGDLRRQYEQQAEQLGVADRVRFAGRVPAEDLPAAYRLAEVLILPSVTRGEAFGVVLLEAMASGRPVIASDLPGVRSVVSHGVDGFLVPPSDAAALAHQIGELLALDPAVRAGMGAAGRRKVEAHYDWERIGDQLEALYRGVLQETRRVT